VPNHLVDVDDGQQVAVIVYQDFREDENSSSSLVLMRAVMSGLWGVFFLGWFAKMVAISGKARTSRE
jgi:hypothetical protein